METNKKSRNELLAEIEELSRRLEEAGQILTAIRNGEVDAVVVSRPEGEQIFTLQGAERPYRVLVETMNEGAATLAPDGTILYGNRCLATMLQIPLEKLIGSPLASYVAPADNALFSLRLQMCAEEFEKEEISLLTESGNQLPVLFSCVSVELTDRQGVNVVLTDISARKQAEEQILRLNRLYAVRSGTNETIVYAVDRDALFRDICRVAVDKGGFRMAWIGLVDEASRTINPVAWSGFNEGLLENIRVSLRETPEGSGTTGSAIRTEGLSIVNDIMNDPRFSFREEAEKRGYRSSAAISLKLNNQVIGVLTLYSADKDFFNAQFADLLLQMGLDISFALNSLDLEARRMEAEQALRDEIIERLQLTEALHEKERLLILQSRMAAMGEMLINISHQWRQPLNVLGLKVQQIGLSFELGGFSKELLDTNIAKAMEIIFHLSQTIDDFRDFSAPDKAKSQFKVGLVVTKTVSLLKDNFRELGIAIDVSSSGEPQIYGHPNEYGQVLLNVLMNAKDAFAEHGTVDERITIRFWTEDGRAVLTITDNAGGIKEEIIDKIFDPYYTTKELGKGTGVGLFMSKTIIEKNMAGRFSVRNVDNGAEFRIEI